MTTKIDLNCDMGESLGVYKMGLDEEIIKYISSANIACGFHAGDPVWMNRTVQLAEKHGVAIGAHPSYPDLIGFGRRKMDISSDETKTDLIYQIGALRAFTKKNELQHVKPHGAMYNQAVNDENLARTICEAVLEVDPSMFLIALSGSKWVDIAENMGLQVAREVFADRALNPDGTLVSRSLPNSIILDVDKVAEQSLNMVTHGKATTINGSEIDVQADSLCIHGDTPGAINMAYTVRKVLEDAGVKIVPLGQFISGCP